MMQSDGIGVVAEEGQPPNDQHRQQDLSLKTQQQLANVFGAAQKESRNKNRIQNPQVTKSSMSGNTLEKLAGSAHKLHK